LKYFWLEFEQRVADRYWFCRIVLLSADKRFGYLVVAQDWTNIGENLRQRMLLPVGAALVVVALIGALIPIAVSRYVSKPLADTQGDALLDRRRDSQRRRR
jgi:hypothetical protein